MPVAQQPPHHHHHASSLFSSINTLLHAFHPSSQPNPSAVAPFSTPPPPPSTHSSERVHLYEAFEANLAHRLSLLLPVEDSACVNMASLKQSMEVLLATQADLISLMPSHRYPLSQTQSRMMEEFLDRSVKLLDVCRAIQEQIADVEGLKGMLQLVVLCLGSKQGRSMLNMGQVGRARKALGELLYNMVRNREEVPPVYLHQSFRLRCREHLAGDDGPDAPQRWRSWHGNSSRAVATTVGNTSNYATSHTLQPSRQLQSIGAVLTPPKISAGDVEESFCAAIYALNVVSIFFLGTITAALPSFNKTHIVSFPHPRAFMWASPLSHLQEKVQEELRLRGKKSSGYAGMWELDQIASIVKRLYELTETVEFPLPDGAREEMKNLVKQLRQHVEELDKDLGPLDRQIAELYSRIVTSRMEILDVCNVKA